MGAMPLTGLFILFDFIVQNSYHEESARNLALLEAVTGYFNLIDYTSDGELPGRIASEFTRIAKDFSTVSHSKFMFLVG